MCQYIWAKKKLYGIQILCTAFHQAALVVTLLGIIALLSFSLSFRLIEKNDMQTRESLEHLILILSSFVSSSN